MKISSQMVWGLLNQGCNIFIPFVIMFMSYKYLPLEMASVWVIFLSMISLITLFDFGLSPAIVRNVSYVISGAQNLVKRGIDDIIIKDVISYPLLSRLLFDIKRIYLYLSLIAFFIIVIGGLWYFYYISPLDMKTEVAYSWLLFSSALIINLIYLYYIPVLTGLGEIESSYKANVLGRIIWFFLSLLVFIFSPSILLLSLSFVFSVFTNRYLCYFFYIRNSHVKAINKTEMEKKSTVPFIGHNAAKLGVVSLGSFLINRSTTLIVGIVCPIVTAGQFVLSMQVFFALMAISNILLSIKMPEISQAVAKREYYTVKQLIYKVFMFSSSIYSLGFIIFLFLVEYLFPAIGVELSFLPLDYLLILGLIYFLEMNHSICAAIITSKNNVPFVFASLFSGGMIIMLSIILSVHFKYGVTGLIFSQGFVQLMYNNWKWPTFVYNEFIKKR
ncbi:MULTISPECIES: O-unit flippase-like protein [Yersinia pseudotuberculosis complex]|uniref:Wzx protein n=2 Tax=Yersinia pseudotuberculosis complex TaxID=1649845 RepID=B7ZEW0_YERPU|nr:MULTISPECIES: O-unit flippase-like protein [Yersinia pseudotuberculosis complex]CAX18357.1 wzx [Yersinia pseudotuberculosis]CRG49453.1 O-unit flippase-like protein [Yersinia wautersii]CRY69915.1 O-unit flippase-like protein [Yersinia pseudotuberculosis]